jgi:hypothetical protein
MDEEGSDASRLTATSSTDLPRSGVAVSWLIRVVKYDEGGVIRNE